MRTKGTNFVRLSTAMPTLSGPIRASRFRFRTARPSPVASLARTSLTTSR